MYLKTLFNFLLLFMILLSAQANDAGQALPDQVEDNVYNNSDEYKPETDFSIMERADPQLDKTEHFFPSISKPNKYIGSASHERSQSEDVLLNPSPEGYFSFREKDEVRKYTNKGKTDFSFFFLNDSFDYTDRNDIFKRTFETGDDGIKGGVLLFSMNKYLSRSLLLNTKIGINFGFGFNEGDGFFVPDPVTGNVEQSTAQVKLWTVPIEFNAGIEFNLTKYLKLQGSAGPSAMLLIQTRADRDEEDDGKEIRQVGFGYFALVAAKISLSDIFQSSVGYKTLTTYDMSRMSFDIYGKHQNISGFKNKDIKITGTSIGFGFSFEYL